jgi:hypothetical protein
MARAAGISASSVHRVWRAFSFPPHRVDRFKLSTDPQFIEKVRDIVGLYLDPPDKALVICVDEKSQIQEALDRTQTPVIPGTVIDQCMPRHRVTEVRKFLGEVERNVPDGLDIHVVMDNASTHKARLILDWFAKRPQRHMHFTPTSSSSLNQLNDFSRC